MNSGWKLSSWISNSDKIFILHFCFALSFFDSVVLLSKQYKCVCSQHWCFCAMSDKYHKTSRLKFCISKLQLNVLEMLVKCNTFFLNIHQFYINCFLCDSQWLYLHISLRALISEKIMFADYHPDKTIRAHELMSMISICNSKHQMFFCRIVIVHS